MAGEYTLRPAGELDFEQAQQLRPQWLAAMAEHQPDTLVVDLAELPRQRWPGLARCRLQRPERA